MGSGDDVFDEDEYLRSCVRPMRGSPKDLPLDLRRRYAVPVTSAVLDDPGHLRDRIAAVVGLWQQLRRSDLVSLSRVGTELLDGHERLLADHSVRLEDPVWWQAYRPPVPPPPAAVERSPTGPEIAGPGPTTPRSPDPGSTVRAPSPAADPTPVQAPTAPADPPSVPDRPTDLRAEHEGRAVRLSWIWPSWAGEAQVSWDGHVRRLTRNEVRSEGWWRSPELGTVETELTFTVAVRGTAPGRTEWSAAVAKTIAPPPLEVTYAVRRQRQWGARAYEVTLTTDRPPLTCEVVVVFAPSGHLPASAADGVELARLYLAWASTAAVVTVDRSRGSGWLRCFVRSTQQPVVLTDPDIATLRVV